MWYYIIVVALDTPELSIAELEADNGYRLYRLKVTNSNNSYYESLNISCTPRGDQIVQQRAVCNTTFIQKDERQVRIKQGFFSLLFFYVNIEKPEGPNPHQLKSQPQKPNPRPNPKTPTPNPQTTINEQKWENKYEE